MENYGNFAFGNPVLKVQQKDISPKKVFVLGVYASAVHAKWVSADGLRKIRALAVASEPEIFWRGDNADKIIAGINIPSAAGALLPASSNYNGPSGRVLDKYILNPLKFERYDAWLCDLIPYSLKNDNQEYALCKLNPFLQQLSLPLDTRRRASKRKIEDKRIEEIIDELKASKADLIITLGNEPIKYFINYFNKNILRLPANLMDRF